MSEPDYLYGVVDPLPGMPPEVRDRPYDQAVASLRQARDSVRAQIERHVEDRQLANDAIKVLRAEDKRLSRMVRIADEPEEPAE